MKCHLFIFITMIFCCFWILNQVGTCDSSFFVKLKMFFISLSSFGQPYLPTSKSIQTKGVTLDSYFHNLFIGEIFLAKLRHDWQGNLMEMLSVFCEVAGLHLQCETAKPKKPNRMHLLREYHLQAWHSPSTFISSFLFRQAISPPFLFPLNFFTL